MAPISIDVVKSIVKAIAKTIINDDVKAISRAISIAIDKNTVDGIDNPIVSKNLKIFSTILSTGF